MMFPTRRPGLVMMGLLLLMPFLAQGKDWQLGRLFSTPERRAKIDLKLNDYVIHKGSLNQISQQETSKLVGAGVDKKIKPNKPTETQPKAITIRLTAIRFIGQSPKVWINGQALSHHPIAGLKLNDRNVSYHAAQFWYYGRAFVLKLGRSITLQPPKPKGH